MRARRLPWLAGIALLACLMPEAATGDVGSGSGSGSGSDGAAPPKAEAAPPCPAPDKPLRYPDVQPIFEQRCAKCHDARQSQNTAAQDVFEMSSYPFATKRPARLLADLQAILPKRGLPPDAKCRAMSWVSAGALDAAGNPPRWR